MEELTELAAEIASSQLALPFHDAGAVFAGI